MADRQDNNLNIYFRRIFIMAKKSAYEPHYGKMAVGFEKRLDFEK